MSVEVISILILVGIFLIATVRPVNLGALAIVAAFVLGMFVLDGADLGEKATVSSPDSQATCSSSSSASRTSSPSRRATAPSTGSSTRRSGRWAVGWG